MKGISFLFEGFEPVIRHEFQQQMMTAAQGIKIPAPDGDALPEREALIPDPVENMDMGDVVPEQADIGQIFLSRNVGVWLPVHPEMWGIHILHQL